VVPACLPAQVRATAPPESGVLSVSCPVRRVVAIFIPVCNPGNHPLVFRTSYSSPALVGPARVTVPPGGDGGSAGGGGGSEGGTGGSGSRPSNDGSRGNSTAAAAAVFECYFAPLTEGESEGIVRLVGEEAGEALLALFLGRTLEAWGLSDTARACKIALTYHDRRPT
jgi:hypothetical protein